jgi:hypothetical protein
MSRPLTVSSDDGTRAIDADKDFVRLEIERAFVPSVNVVPVLVDRFSAQAHAEVPLP